MKLKQFGLCASFLWLTLSVVSASAQVIKATELYEQCAQPLAESAASPAKQIAALKASDPKQRSTAAEALAKSCDIRAVEPLIAALKDEDANVRLSVIAALGQLGGVDSVDPMIDALGDTDPRVRAALGLSLGSFPVHRARNAVLNILVNPGGNNIKDEGDMRARCFGVLVVNQMIDVRFSRKSIGFLFGFLDHPDPKLRAVAEATAVELEHTRNGLREMFGIIKVNNFPEFRRKAIDWLGRWGDPEARDLLTEVAANDRDASVKQAAATALTKLKK